MAQRKYGTYGATILGSTWTVKANGTIINSPGFSYKHQKTPRNIEEERIVMWSDPRTGNIGHRSFYKYGQERIKSPQEIEYEKEFDLGVQDQITKMVKADKIAQEKAQEVIQKAVEAKAWASHPLITARLKATMAIEKEYDLAKNFGMGKDFKTWHDVRQGGIEAGYQVSKNLLKAADLAWDRYATLTEDYMGKQAMSNAEDTIRRVTNLAGSAIAGYKLGGVYGAAASVIGWGASQYLDYQKKMSGYYRQLNATNFQTDFAQSRLGLIGSSGTEN